MQMYNEILQNSKGHHIGRLGQMSELQFSKIILE